MKRKEFDIHSELAELLKKQYIIDETSTWGSSGPDIYIKGKAIIEVKSTESQQKIKEAYCQIIQREEREEWKPSSLKYFVIVTPKKARVYINHKNQYNNLNNPDCAFDYEKERKQFIEFLKNDRSKIKIELFLEEILLDLYAQKEIEHLAIVRMLIHFDKQITFFQKGIVVNQGKNSELIIESHDKTLTFAKNLYQKYYTEDISKIKDNIIHNWSSYQVD